VLIALYRKHSEGRYSFAVITRDAHPKVESYNHKAFPYFLPNDDEFIKLWLSNSVHQHSWKYHLKISYAFGLYTYNANRSK
jgi:hypothetical protein